MRSKTRDPARGSEAAVRRFNNATLRPARAEQKPTCHKLLHGDAPTVLPWRVMLPLCGIMLLFTLSRPPIYLSCLAARARSSPHSIFRAFFRAPLASAPRRISSSLARARSTAEATTRGGNRAGNVRLNRHVDERERIGTRSYPCDRLLYRTVVSIVYFVL